MRATRFRMFGRNLRLCITLIKPFERSILLLLEFCALLNSEYKNGKLYLRVTAIKSNPLIDTSLYCDAHQTCIACFRPPKSFDTP